MFDFQSREIDLVCSVLLCIMSFSNGLLSQTSLELDGDRWMLMVDDKPFEVKGATFGYSEDVENYDAYFEELHFLGVNTIRTWGTGENTEKLLDAAERQGIKVMLGIWMRHGRPGMEADDRFDYLTDTLGKIAMYDDAIQTVKRYKDHPALLFWGVGNEVYLNMATDKEKEVYSRLLEKICRDIKALDPNHLVASVEAWTFGMDWWKKWVPSLDIYGINTYGPGANLIASEMEKRGIERPYIITEFGVTGEWDIKEKKNGIKVEPTDGDKYNTIVDGYRNWIINKPANIGVFVFHYSNGNSHMSPWLLTHHRGKKRPQFWAIREAYTGEDPLNYCPEVNSFVLNDSLKKSGEWVAVELSVADKENEALAVSFYYNQRTGSRKRRDQLSPIKHRGNLEEGIELQMPREHGAIKVYINVEDTYGNVGIASTSILVEDEEAQKKKYLVPKAELPFYVYKDGQDLPYIPSGLMGNFEAIHLDLKHTEGVHSGKYCIKIGFEEFRDWYGVGFVDPPNDWGDNLGGYDLSGATKLTFWAKASEKNVKATIGMGMIGNEKDYPDTAKKSIDVKLGTKWKKYTVKLKKLDLSCIRSGFVLFSSTSFGPHEIFIDEVVFE